MNKVATLFKCMYVYEQTHLGTTNYTRRIEYAHTALKRGQNTVLLHEDHIM